MPECYIINEEHMDAERMKPNSQDFYPASLSEFGHHLWSNAVYLIALLLSKAVLLFLRIFGSDGLLVLCDIGSEDIILIL